MLNITECPTCGSGRIKLVRRNWHGESKGRPYVVPNLQFHECPDCGERIYDPTAMRKIEAHRPSRIPARKPSAIVG